MKTSDDIRHETYRELYHRERARREQIRGSVGTPVAALAFSVFNLSSLATAYDFTRWSEPTGIAIMALTFLSVAALIASTIYIVRVEWLFLYADPPDLHEFVAAEHELREDFAGNAGTSEQRVYEQMVILLTASYDIAYQRYLKGNEFSAHCRTQGLRLVMLALLCLSVAFLLLPVHLASAQGG